MTYWFTLVLVVLATLRVTRLVTTDKIGEHYLIGALRLSAQARCRSPRCYDYRHMEEDTFSGLPKRHPRPCWRHLLIELVDCPFCIGFWISVGAVLAWLWVPHPVLGWVAAPFALSWVVGQVSSRLD